MMNPSNLSTSQLMRKRNGKKWGITKAIQEIETIVSERGSQSKVQFLKISLGDLLHAAVEAHKQLMFNIDENDPNFSDEWIEDLSLRVNTCYANIESYFHDRKDDPPSSENSISARKKEVEEWRQNSLFASGSSNDSVKSIERDVTPPPVTDAQIQSDENVDEANCR